MPKCESCYHYHMCDLQYRLEENQECKHFEDKEYIKKVEWGQWIPQDVSSRGLSDWFVCSVCNSSTFTSHKYAKCPDKYCRYCGAKM